MNHDYENLDTPLYLFNGTEHFTIRQAFEGVQIFGGIGSGKTSGSGQALAKSYLRAGFGGLSRLYTKKRIQKKSNFELTNTQKYVYTST